MLGLGTAQGGRAISCIYNNKKFCNSSSRVCCSRLCLGMS